MDTSNSKLINQHFDELIQVYPGLVMSQDTPECWVIRGILSFSATYNDINIKDEYSVLITLAVNYPDLPPTVQETGGRIPPNFHQNADRTLCLGAPLEVYKRFKERPRLLPFVQTSLIEYLYGYSHLIKYGYLPFGELSHGYLGVREYYQDMFKTDDVKILFSLLRIITDGVYRGHHKCPCGSGNILRKCHGPIILNLLKIQAGKRVLRDATYIYLFLDESEQNMLTIQLLPKKINQELNVIKGEIVKFL